MKKLFLIVVIVFVFVLVGCGMKEKVSGEGLKNVIVNIGI